MHILSEENYKELYYCRKYNIIVPRDIRLKIYKHFNNDYPKIITCINKICLTKDEVIHLFPELNAEKNVTKYTSKIKEIFI